MSNERMKATADLIFIVLAGIWTVIIWVGMWGMK